MQLPIRQLRFFIGWAVVIGIPLVCQAQIERSPVDRSAEKRSSDPRIELGQNSETLPPERRPVKAADVTPVEGKTEPPQPNKTRYWTTKWSFRDVDVERFLSRLTSVGIEIPVEASGNVTIELDVSIPLNRIREGRAYRFKGKLRSPDLRLENLRLTDVQADLQYDDGVLILSQLKSGWSDVNEKSVAEFDAAEKGSLSIEQRSRGSRGKLSGTAKMQLLPQGDLTARVDLQRLPLASLQNLLMGTPETDSPQPSAGVRSKPIQGDLSGQVTATVAVKKLSEIQAWSVDGQLQLSNVKLNSTMPVTLQTGAVKLRRGVVLAEQVSVASSQDPSVQLGLALELELIGQQRFQFQLKADDFPLGLLSGAIGTNDKIVTGKLDLDLHGQGDIKTRQWDLQGRIGSPDCHLFGQGIGILEHRLRFNREQFELLPEHPELGTASGMLIRKVRATYALQRDAFELREFDAELFGGRVGGRMTISRHVTKRHSLQLNWRDLEPRLVNRAMGTNPLQFRLQTSGEIVWSLPFEGWRHPIEHEGEARIRIDPIAINRGQVGFAEVSAAAQHGIFKIDGDGQVLGGKFSIDLVTRALADDSWRSFLHRSPEGHARIDQVQLDRFVRTLWPRHHRRIRGTLAARLSYHVDEKEGATVPACRVVARDVALDGRMLTRQLEADAMVRGDRFVVERVRGSLAGGQLVADGKWTLGSGPRQMHVRVSGVDVSDVLFPIAKSMSPNLAGVSSGSATVTYSQGFRFRGALTSRDSELFGIPMGTLHSGMAGTLSPDLRRWIVQFPSIQGDVAKGQLAGEMQLSSSQSRTKSFDMSSRWNARRVDFGHMLTTSNITSRIAHGRVSGELTLGGRGIRGIHDLKGRFDARLGTTQAAAIPGLLQADQFLGLITLSGSQFKEGRAKGVIGAGDALIDEFELSSDRIRVWSQGKIRLDNLRMDMEVVISTGNFRLASQELLAFAGQLAMQSVFPFTSLLEVNRILRDRTIYLDVTGSMRDPRLRLKPLEIIREEALRFLIRELLVAASIRTD